MGFLIGFKDNAVRQSYVAYRYRYNFERVSDGSFVTIDDNEMPFGMKAQNTIGGEFWPRSSDEDTIYLASTYDQKKYALVHVIQEGGDLLLFIRYLSQQMDNEWIENKNPKVHPMKDGIKIFKGFIQIRVSNVPDLMSWSLALVQLEGSPDDSLIDFDPEINNNFEEQRHFLSQVLITSFDNN